MRVVRAGATLPVPANLVPGLLPSDDELEHARTLGERFREVAGLKPVQLVRLQSSTLGPQRPYRVWVALEALQVTGSFKVRGALLALERRIAEAKAKATATHSKSGPFTILAASAGNHGVGVAHAARVLGAKAEIVVPKGAPRTKVDKIREAGATVIESSSAGYDEAEAEAIRIAERRGLPFLSPYDDLDVLAGNGASLGFEIVHALGRVPERVFCPIGGGGLATGLASAFDYERRQRTGEGRRGIVVPVQSEASCAFAMSIERGGNAVTELPPKPTLAEGLEGGISERAFIRARALIDNAIVCTEDEILAAMKYIKAALGGLVVEGSAAVAMVPELPEMPSLSLLGLGLDLDSADFKVAMSESQTADVVIVLTGQNIDADRAAALLGTT
jgi:threonine dehydratase